MTEAVHGASAEALTADVSLTDVIPEQRDHTVTDIHTAHRQIFVGVLDDLLQPGLDWGSDRLDPATIARIVEADGFNAYANMGKEDSIERQANADYTPALRYVRLDPEDAETTLGDIPPDHKLYLGSDHWLTMDGPVPTAAIRQDRLSLQRRMEALIREYARDGLRPDDAPGDHETGHQHAAATGGKALLGATVDFLEI